MAGITMTERERVRKKLVAILGDSDKIKSAVDDLDTALGLVKYCAAWGTKVYAGIGVSEDGSGIIEAQVLDDDTLDDKEARFEFEDVDFDAALAACKAWLWMHETLWEDA